MPPRRSVSEDATLPVAAYEESSRGFGTDTVTPSVLAMTTKRKISGKATTADPHRANSWHDKGNDKDQKRQKYRTVLLLGAIFVCCAAFGFVRFVTRPKVSSASRRSLPRETRTVPSNPNGATTKERAAAAAAVGTVDSTSRMDIPPGFDTLLQRAVDHSHACQALQETFTGFDTRSAMPFHNDTVASLPSFGVISALQSYFQSNDPTPWPTCQLPPKHECAETQLTVIFMAYNPDRLGTTNKEIKKLLNPSMFHNLVQEIILVWNGERHVDESPDGVALLAMTQTMPIRIVYPLKMGFPNDLFNRYHPHVVVPNTKALLYYDDDGPFYSYEAIQGGFELWKRHARAQIGAMSRQITYSSRQQEEQWDKLGRVPAGAKTKSNPADDQFLSHCTNVDDMVDYQFRFFANYDANMVLPSGSLLHSNYLCYLWHPALAELRNFVLTHPVRPDDMTVSMLVSQLAGVAPRVYSRRLDKNDAKATKSRHQKRRLSVPKWTRRVDVDTSVVNDDGVSEREQGLIPHWAVQQQRRSLMFSICWDCGAGMTEMKQYWAELRTEAVNALVRYFGSLNSGSMGWCAVDSPYYNAAKDGRCDPVMAKQGWLPWMKPDGTPRDTCP